VDYDYNFYTKVTHVQRWDGMEGDNCAVYSLGGDTAAPSGLYARLCHTFLVGSSLLVLARW